MILASLFSFAGPDLLIILLIVLVLFGAKKLPALAKGMGQAMKEFQKAKDDFNHELHSPGESAGKPEHQASLTEIADADYRRQEL